ncbi:uncharacterized protein LOC114359033 [Ostrinia furnacalis]|uniref:uncharacterized protein LOC114359033 n=1 Tax=Ostrinia furnacalis TaxID=93504 RepID=UPI001039F2A9|nr:uncharacterized protein LOC114359033 [Ostrinia furnacalis]
MHTEEDDVPITPKKKLDKGQSSSDTADSSDKSDPKKTDGEDPKPRIVLTFRSDKKNCNMKIVPNDEKHEESSPSPRRSTRSRHKWEWSEDAEMSISPKKEKNSSQSVSENDEASDSSHATPKRLTRGRSKESSDNVLANAIARKEKSYNEAAPGPTQRLSRRIKPTAKILANEELRIGLESQNNARLGLQSDKPEEGVRTRKSARSMPPEVDLTQVTPAMYLLDRNKKETRSSKAVEEEEAPEVSDEAKQSPNTVMKLKHLCELGLKAINPETMEDEGQEEEEYENEELEEDEDEIDDDSEVISKLLEADDDDDSDEDFSCSAEVSQAKRPRRSTRLCSSYGESELAPFTVDDDQKEEYNYRPSRKRSRRNEEVPVEEPEESKSNRDVLPRRAKNTDPWKRSDSKTPDTQSVVNIPDDNDEPAGGDEGSEAACPEDEASTAATCFCETPSNIYAAPGELTEPVFCQAIETVDGVRVGCSHAAAREDGTLRPLLRAGPRAPFVLTCTLHAAQLRAHMCCPNCGLFCTQGTFYQCSLGHLFHLECGLPHSRWNRWSSDAKARPGCPHCGVGARRWTPRNSACRRVALRMDCSNKRIFLPDQREQCTPAYLGFTSLAKPQEEPMPLIPEGLLPSPPIDLKALCESNAAKCDPSRSPAQSLCDAILAGESIQQLLPKIAAARSTINEQITSLMGGSCVHAACKRGDVAALYLLQYAGADLCAADNALRTPLVLAAQCEYPYKYKRDDAAALYLLQYAGADLCAADNALRTPLVLAAQCEYPYKYKRDDAAALYLLQYAGADLCAADNALRTPLVLAAQCEYPYKYKRDDAAALYLLQYAGADLCAADNALRTPLVLAAQCEYPYKYKRDDAAALYLLQYAGADLCAADNALRTPLVLAAQCEYPYKYKRDDAAALYLLQYAGADLCAADNALRTPLVLAAQCEYPYKYKRDDAAALYLLQYAGADLCAADNALRTPLVLAAQCEYPYKYKRDDAAALYLLQYAGADLCAADNALRTPLVLAAQCEYPYKYKRDDAAALYLLQYAGADLCAADNALRTPLVLAAQCEYPYKYKRDDAAALYLLQYAGADLCAADNALRTPLVLAAQCEYPYKYKRDDAAALYLLQYAGADLCAADNALRTPLVLAAQCEYPYKYKRDDAAALYLLQYAGADLCAADNALRTPLVLAAQCEYPYKYKRDDAAALYLLQYAGADLCAADNALRTPLVLAAQCEYPYKYKRDDAAALYLLQYAGADLCAADNALRTPLVLAAQCEYPYKYKRDDAAALYLLQYAGADLCAADNALRTPLVLAAQLLVEKSEKKSPIKSKKLKEKEIKEDSKSKEETDEDTKEGIEEQDDSIASIEECKVGKASREDLMKFVRYLVAAGCDINIQGPEGMTALHIAAQGGDVELCTALLEAGDVSVDSRDLGGWTPLVWAAENDHVDVVRLLLSRGADATTRDSEGNGCVHWCALAGHARSLRLLLAAAPHAHAAPNAHKDTPLHVAARQGHYSCVVILLARGARTDVENSAGELPVEVCSGACQSVVSLNMQMSLAAKGQLRRGKLLASDLSNGCETYALPCVNQVDDTPAPDDFTYVTDHVMPEPLSIDNTIQSMQGCECKDGDCSGGGCACCVLSVRRWSSALGRLPPAFPHHDPPMMFECNATCACNKRKCGNMVISRLQQRGSLFIRAEVFRTARAGWGLRAVSAVPRGSPVALYCGELLPLARADARPNDQYLFALDIKPDLQQVILYAMRRQRDPMRGRMHMGFSGALHEPQLCAQPGPTSRVHAGTRPRRARRRALRHAFDYGDKFWSVKSKWMKCECGSPECRYPVKSTEADA